MTDTSEGLDAGAADLLARLVQANVDSLAATTDQVIAGEKHTQKVLAAGLRRLVDGIEAIPSMMRSVYLDRLLEDPEVWAALHVADRLRDEGSSSD